MELRRHQGCKLSDDPAWDSECGLSPVHRSEKLNLSATSRNPRSGGRSVDYYLGRQRQRLGNAPTTFWCAAVRDYPHGCPKSVAVAEWARRLDHLHGFSLTAPTEA